MTTPPHSPATNDSTSVSAAWRAARVSFAWSLIAAAIACMVAAADFANAQPALRQWMTGTTMQNNGSVTQMPADRPFSRRNGLSLSVDTRWANNYGYRPIKVTLNSPAATKADHLVTIRLGATWWSRQRGSVIVEQDFEMPLGSTAASATIALPQYQLAMQYFWWEVWIDGVKDKDLSLDEQDAMRTMAGAVSSGSPPKLAILAIGAPSQQRTLWLPSLPGQGESEFEILSLTAAELPQRWLDYTSLDVVMLSRNELDSLAQNYPRAMDAVLDWVRAGGQLWVSDAGADWEHIPEIARTLGMSPAILGIDEGAEEPDDGPPGAEIDDSKQADAADAATTNAATADAPSTPTAADEVPIADEPPGPIGWNPIRFGRNGPEGQVLTFLHLPSGQLQVARDPQTIAQLQSDTDYVVTNQEFQPDPELPQRRWPRDSADWFIDQRLGFGAVRAYHEDFTKLFSSPRRRPSEDQPGVDRRNRQPPSASRLTLGTTRRWESRHGMAPDDANEDFANWLVPGVGLAPVTEFRVLITLFVLLIGPVNYWLLKRVGRLHLLVLTVPLAAALMTATLFAYAVVSDGFGTTVRVQSFATLDQRTGDAASWARLSYYSGLAPGDGLTMPSDVATYPIIPGWNESSIDSSVGTRREIIWAGDEARLTLGWLRSRTPTQYLTVRARKSPHRLELTAAGDELQATNSLGSTIDEVFVVDEAGKLHVAANLDDGATATLTPIDRTEAIRRVRERIVDNEPEKPLALTGDSDFTIVQRRDARRMMRNQFGLNYSEQRLAANLVNDMLADLAGIAGQPALQLPPKSYLAFTRRGPEVAIGLPNAEEESSFHVVLGIW